MINRDHFRQIRRAIIFPPPFSFLPFFTVPIAVTEKWSIVGIEKREQLLLIQKVHATIFLDFCMTVGKNGFYGSVRWTYCVNNQTFESSILRPNIYTSELLVRKPVYLIMGRFAYVVLLERLILSVDLFWRGCILIEEICGVLLFWDERVSVSLRCEISIMLVLVHDRYENTDLF